MLPPPHTFHDLPTPLTVYLYCLATELIIERTVYLYCLEGTYIELILKRLVLATILYLLESLQSYRNWWLDRARTRETDGPYD